MQAYKPTTPPKSKKSSQDPKVLAVLGGIAVILVGVVIFLAYKVFGH